MGTSSTQLDGENMTRPAWKKTVQAITHTKPPAVAPAFLPIPVSPLAPGAAIAKVAAEPTYLLFEIYAVS
jgi:hypothetical protein